MFLWRGVQPSEFGAMDWDEALALSRRFKEMREAEVELMIELVKTHAKATMR